MKKSDIIKNAQQISTRHLISIIGDYAWRPTTNDPAMSAAMAKLHCAASVGNDPQEDALPDYIRIGIASLGFIPTHVGIEVEKIGQEIIDIEDMSDDDDDNICKITELEDIIYWLSAFSYAAAHSDIVEITMALTLEWAELNGIELSNGVELYD